VSNCGDATAIAFTKGSVDSLLAVSSHIWDKGQSHPLDRAVQQKILADNDQLARNGMRVLGIAFRLLNSQILVAMATCKGGRCWKKISPSSAWSALLTRFGQK
jgi:magnesium-transporting ATPase (P-type)